MIIKRIIALILYYFLIIKILKLFIRKKYGKSANFVLLYHRVVCKKKRHNSMPEMTVTPEMFNAQMKYLAKHYSIINLENFICHEEIKSKSRKLRALVTFDDGWRDNYQYAYPILKKYKIEGLIFITTNFVNTNKLFWPEHFAGLIRKIFEDKIDQRKLDQISKIIYNNVSQHIKNKMNLKKTTSNSIENITKDFIKKIKYLPKDKIDSVIVKLGGMAKINSKKLNYERSMLNWDEIREMYANGIVFGAHTRNHIILDSIDDKSEIINEVLGSKHDIEKNINQKVYAFAYPNGNYNSQIVDIIRKNGFKIAFTTQYGFNNSSTKLFEQRRIRVDDSFSCGLFGKFSPALFEFNLLRHAILL